MIKPALIILASGMSTRFEDGHKLLADLNGKTVAGHVIDNVRAVDFGARYAVTADEVVTKLFAEASFTIIHNTAPKAGQGLSLSLGAQAAIYDGHEAICICLADMPFVDTVHLEKLLKTEGDRVMSECGGVHMPPAVFRGKALKQLTQTKGDSGAKGGITMRNVVTITLSESAARDIDTRMDLDAAT